MEVMVAVAIVGALLVTLIYTLNYHLSIAERQETLTIAYLLARDKMEEMMKEEPTLTGGDLSSPYARFRYMSEARGSVLPGWLELQVLVTDGREEARLVALVKKNER